MLIIYVQCAAIEDNQNDSFDETKAHKDVKDGGKDKEKPQKFKPGKFVLIFYFSRTKWFVMHRFFDFFNQL